MNQFLQLFRLGNCFMGVIGLMVAAFIGAGADLLDHWRDLAVASMVVFTFIAGGNSLNDYIDREVDRIAHPSRPVPSGRMGAGTALKVSAAAFAVSILVSGLLSWEAAAVVVVAIVLILAYEFRYKRTGVMGNVIIAVLTGLLFILGGVVVGAVMNTVAIAGMAGLVTIGREITKDIEDIEGDFDRRTLPMAIGTRNAGLVAALCYLSGVALSMQPVLAGLFNDLYFGAVLAADAIFIYCAWILFKNPRAGQRYAKFGMMVALVAFILGGF